MKQSDTVSTLIALLKRPLQLLLLRALRDVYYRLDRIDSRLDASDSRLDAIDSRLGTIDSRLGQIEPRTLSTRDYALQEIAEYLALARINGDYCEFGVSQGHVFCCAAKLFSAKFPAMRFLAFDSFEGLPEPKSHDATGDYSGGFSAGEFACSEATFIANLRRGDIDLTRVTTFPGWFDVTLRQGSPALASVRPVAVAWIDCDYYESTVPVLEFLTNRLVVGSVIAFDDWGCFRNLPDKGEQRACREWLERHSAIRLHELMSFGWSGKVFTVGAC
jgi:O-methyltransferase